MSNQDPYSPPAPGGGVESLRKYINSRRKLHERGDNNNPFFKEQQQDSALTRNPQSTDQTSGIFKNSEVNRERAKIKYRNQVVTERQAGRDVNYASPRTTENKYIRKENGAYVQRERDTSGRKINSEYIPRSQRAYVEERKVISNVRKVEYRVENSGDRRFAN